MRNCVKGSEHQEGLEPRRKGHTLETEQFREKLFLGKHTAAAHIHVVRKNDV